MYAVVGAAPDDDGDGSCLVGKATKVVPRCACAGIVTILDDVGVARAKSVWAHKMKFPAHEINFHYFNRKLILTDLIIDDFQCDCLILKI